jgi:hypothetical protein
MGSLRFLEQYLCDPIGVGELGRGRGHPVNYHWVRAIADDKQFDGEHGLSLAANTMGAGYTDHG